uniref:G-protein coupled receptors family 1 profile domain-containing protein n=1 Tax=Pundamilia nyererei TaxID=303518 RepID=A0A3B4G0M0_9CICH
MNYSPCAARDHKNSINSMSCVLLHLFIIHLYSLQVRRSPVPVIYYTNLLLSNLIQICIMIVWLLRIGSSIPAVIHLSCVMASLYFRMCVALERYLCFHISYPLLDCLRQTRSSVLVCVLVWAFCIVSVPLAIVLDELGRLFIHAVLPGPLFIFCLARTFRALPAATSVPTEEKRRSLGILILLFFYYFLIVVSTIISNIFRYFSVVFGFFLLSPFVDLILFLFMLKGCIDKLLACLCSADGRV